MATTIDGAYENMKRYLSEKVKLPTAFFADNRYDRAGGYEGYGRVWNPDSGGHIYCGI